MTDHGAPITAETADPDLFGTTVTKPVPAPDPRVSLTERDMLDRLAERYGRMYANGPHKVLRHIGARHVRFGPLWPSCIADFLVLDTWGNYGEEHLRHPLLGFEVKISRSDYLREIKALSKSEPFRKVCAEWYMVVSDPKIVRDDLPDGWGLLIAQGDGLRCVRKSATNPNPDPMPRGLIAGFMRAVAMQSRESALRHSPGSTTGGDLR